MGVRGKLSNVTISNSSFRFRSTPQVSPHLPACMEIGDKSAATLITGLLVRNVTCDGFQMTGDLKKLKRGRPHV